MNIILGLLKGILSMKFGWIIAIVVGIVVGGSIIRNIFTGSFNVMKFASGFNIFAGGVQGKLIYYGLLAILAFGLYHQLTRATYDTDYTSNYKNNIVWNRDVNIDQKQIINNPEDNLMIGIKIFGFKIGISRPVKSKVIQNINNKAIINPKSQTSTTSVISNSVSKSEKKKSNTLINVVKIVTGVTIIVVATHFIIKIFKKKGK